jgi:hypothetical protein
VDIAQEQAGMSSAKVKEDYSVPGVITCFASMPKGVSKVATVNAAAKTARDRACTILEEVNDYMTGARTVGSTVLDAWVAEVKLTQGLAPEAQLGRWCSIEFTISAEAQFVP